MTHDTKPSQKKYYYLTDLASRWKLEDRELLRLALERGIGIAIHEFRGADHHIDSVEDGALPNWAVFVSPDVLKRIASVGDAYVSGGFRYSESEAKPVFFPERQLAAEDLILLPKDFDELASLVSEEANVEGQNEPKMLPASRSTLLKQIAMLAVLLSKQQAGFDWGGKPNSSQISIAIGQFMAKWPVETMGKLESDFFSKASINASIKEGLALIGFNKESKDK